MRKFIDLFWRKPKYSNQSIFEINHSFEKAHFLLSAFYFLVLFVCFQSFTFNSQFPSWSEVIDSEMYFMPNWGSSWIAYCDWSLAVRAVYIFFLLSSILGVVFWSRSRIVRIVVAFGLYQYLCLISSFGYTDHYLHMMSMAAIVFILLPLNKSVTYKSDFLKVIFGLQAIILATYSISGFYKLLGLVKQLKRGVASAISPNGMTLQSSKTSYFSGNEYFLQNYLIDHPSYWISTFQIGGILIELVSILILFKIGLHRIWGLILIIFHLAISMTVGPDFSVHALVIALFVLFSPFGSDRYDLVNDVKLFAKK